MKQQQCPLAKGQLYIHSSGKVAPCGFLQGRHWLGDLKDSTLNEIWEGEKSREFTELHQAGENKLCQQMQYKHHCHLLHPNLNPHSERNLKKLDIMIDSHCNLKCIMCTNRSEDNHPLKEIAWPAIESVLPQIEEIELVGGEPLIIKESYDLMDLVLRVNPSIRWVITTNGHYNVSDKLLSYLKKINLYSLSVSIDSFDRDLFQRIRVNGDLDKTLATLKLYQSEINSDYLNINFLIQKDNYHELGKALESGKTNNLPVYPILLTEPESFSILEFPQDKIHHIIEDYLMHAKNYNCFRTINIILKLLKHCETPDRALYLDKLNMVKNEIQQ